MNFFKMSFLAAFIVLTLGLTGCETKGVPGPQGPQGVEGKVGLMGATGLSGAPGQDGNNANPLDLEDSNGARVGPFVGFVENETTITAINIQGNKQPALVKMDGAIYRTFLMFDGAGCTGNAYLPSNDMNAQVPPTVHHFAFGAGGQVWKISSQTAATVVGVVSMYSPYDDGSCTTITDPSIFTNTQFFPVANLGTPSSVHGPLHVRVGNPLVVN